MQKTQGKLFDQHQYQTSRQTQALPITTVLSSQFPEVEQLLTEVKELKATVKMNERRILSIHSMERY